MNPHALTTDCVQVIRVPWPRGSTDASTGNHGSSADSSPATAAVAAQQPLQQLAGGQAAVDVLRGVRDNAYRAAPAQQVDRLRQASIFIDGALQGGGPKFIPTCAVSHAHA
jgi:hypothetical protein